MKRIETLLNRKILECRQKVAKAQREVKEARTAIGQAFSEPALRRAVAELGYLLHLAEPDESALQDY